MTVQQISEWIESFNRSKENDFKTNAILMDGQAVQIISGVSSLISGKNKTATLKKLYPDMFGVKKENENMTEEQKEIQEFLIWKEFLGV